MDAPAKSPELIAEKIARDVNQGVARWPGILTLVALLVGIGLRWLKLGEQSLWFDEGYTAWVVSHAPLDLIHIMRADTAPPFYYLLLRGWTQLFGSSETAMRSMSALIATLSLLLYFPLAAVLLRDRVAVAVAVSLFAVTEMQVAYAHEARFYSLMTLLAEIDLLLVLMVLGRNRPTREKPLTPGLRYSEDSDFRATDTGLPRTSDPASVDHKPVLHRSSRALYAPLILAWSASLYTNNMMAIYLAGLAVAWLVLPGRRSLGGRVIDIAVVGGASALLYLPWLPTMLAQSAALKGRFWVEPPGLPIVLRTLALLCGVNEQAVGWNWRFGTAITALCALALTAIALARPSTRHRAAGLALFGLLPIAAIYLYSRLTQPIFMDRAFIPTTLVMPMLIVLATMRRTGAIAGAIAGANDARSEPPRWLLPTVAMLCLILSALSLPRNYQGEHPEPWRDAIASVGSVSGNRLIVFVANEGELLYDCYARGRDYSRSSRLIGVPRSFFATDPPQTMARVRRDADLDGLRAALADNAALDEVVLVESHSSFSDPSHRVLELLKDRLPLIEQRQFAEISVYRFGRGQ